MAVGYLYVEQIQVKGNHPYRLNNPEKIFQTLLGRNPKMSKTADLLIQQAKVRRYSFITIQVTFTTNFNYVLCGMIITRLAPIECMYYIT